MVNTFKTFQRVLTPQPSVSPCAEVNQVLRRTLLANLLVAGAKVSMGLTSGSISMIADGFHSAMDASSNVIGLVGSTVGSQPPDHEHPYGHSKYETFATLGIGLLLLLTSWNVLTSVVSRFMEGGRPEVTPLNFGVMVVTIVINLAVTTYERRRGLALKSNLLLADAEHTKSDIFVSLSVLVSLIATSWGWFWIDSLVALIIVLVIARTGWQIVRQASDVLADRAVVDTARVAAIARSVEGVQSCHKIRSRGSDQAVYLDLHIQVDGRMSLEKAHYLGHTVQARLSEELGIDDVIVHVEPVD